MVRYRYNYFAYIKLNFSISSTMSLDSRISGSHCTIHTWPPSQVKIFLLFCLDTFLPSEFAVVTEICVFAGENTLVTLITHYSPNSSINNNIIHSHAWKFMRFEFQIPVQGIIIVSWNIYYRTYIDIVFNNYILSSMLYHCFNRKFN